MVNHMVAVSYMEITPMYGIPDPEPVRNNFVNNIWNIL